MLRVRVRYKKLTDTTQETEMKYLCNKMICRGYYDNTDHSWHVVNLINNKTLYKGVGRNEDHAKELIKKSLKSLGANFLDEIRSTKTERSYKLTEELFDEIVKEKEGK
jgi:hypothetical protein